MRREKLPRLAYSESAARATCAEKDDRELMLELRGGDELALDELMTRKTQALVQFVFRMLGDREEARDVTQLTFFKVWQKRLDYNPRFTPNTWIYRIATNLSIDLLRSRRSREASSDSLTHHFRQVGLRQFNKDISRLTKDEVHAIFLQLAEYLTAKQRVIFILREVEGRSSGEVAQILGCRESTVRNHLFNARKVLRGELMRLYPEYVPEHLRGAEVRSP